MSGNEKSEKNLDKVGFENLMTLEMFDVLFGDSTTAQLLCMSLIQHIIYMNILDEMEPETIYVIKNEWIDDAFVFVFGAPMHLELAETFVVACSMGPLDLLVSDPSTDKWITMSDSTTLTKEVLAENFGDVDQVVVRTCASCGVEPIEGGYNQSLVHVSAKESYRSLNLLIEDRVSELSNFGDETFKILIPALVAINDIFKDFVDSIEQDVLQNYTASEFN